jgi:alpha-amylase
MYQILLDRFASSDDKECGDWTDYCGGTIKAAESRLEYLSMLGVDGVAISPTVENFPGGYHGYWPKDLSKTNPNLGTADDLAYFVFRAHRVGMLVTADVNLNHMGKPGMSADRPDDVSKLYPFSSSRYFHTDNCSLWAASDFEQGGKRSLERCALYGMPDLDQRNPETWQMLQQWLRDYVDEFGFDAIRVDAAQHMPQMFTSHIPDSGAPIPAFFEVPQGDIELVAAYSTNDYSAVYNYPLYFVLRDTFQPGTQRRSMTALMDYQKKLREDNFGRVLLNFLDNNDLPRFIDLVRGDLALYHNALVYMTLATGVPVILYGSEQAMPGNGTYEVGNDLWRRPMWEHGYDMKSETFMVLQRLLWLRKRYQGLHKSKAQVFFADTSFLGVARGDIVYLISNKGSSSTRLEQRVVWNNVSTSRRLCEQSVMCDLFGSANECVRVYPGGVSHIDVVDGRPIVLVPETVLKELLADIAGQERRVGKNKDNHMGASESLERSVRKVGPNSWHSMPDPPEIKLETLARFRQTGQGSSALQGEVLDWLPGVEIPMFLNVWHPPLGSPPAQQIRGHVRNACALTIGGQSEMLIARRGTSKYIMCVDEATGACGDSSADMESRLSRIRSEEYSGPILFLSRSSNAEAAFGANEGIITVLSQLVPFLPALRNGSIHMLVSDQQRATYEALFARLQIGSDGLLTPKRPSGEEDAAVLHCTSGELFFSLQSQEFLSKEYLGKIRSEMNLLPNSPLSMGNIVLLMTQEQLRGQRAFALVSELRKLRRGVTILSPDPKNVGKTIETLSRAALLIGLTSTRSGPFLASMLFAPLGVKVLEVLPSGKAAAGHPNPNIMASRRYNRALAGALGLEYSSITVSQEEEDQASRESSDRRRTAVDEHLDRLKELTAILMSRRSSAKGAGARGDLEGGIDAGALAIKDRAASLLIGASMAGSFDL